MSLIVSLILGAVAGWIASNIMNTSGGLLRNIILGIAGGAVGSILFGLIGLTSTGSFVGNMIVSVVGACALIFAGRILFK
ncbi:GlsB/YeaQ/YmgE family stress response membrane protein [Butyrivibrio sp. MC2013]|uniref:GlsB/YeaQ/YmgE family stress response membrane protein n=1 Tax=Butyrivibrio sp. MC2013 TaxID=1280686 RepID=UPI000402A0EA|nr:GlsB/YeaQ/YmgE family stress response membrane protein [Butyrivibrio sp. MC2013]